MNALPPSWADCFAAGNAGRYGPLWIRNAAILQPDGRVWEAPHHHLVIRAIVQERPEQRPVRGEQGFVLQDGSFITREAADQIASTNGQRLGKHIVGDVLFSEELWIHRGEWTPTSAPTTPANSAAPHPQSAAGGDR